VGAALELEIDQKSLAHLRKVMKTEYLIDPPADEFYDAIAIKIGKGAKSKTPVDRGDVKAGIKVIREKDGRSVVATAEHSIYVHEGTRPHWPPIDAVRGWAQRHNMEPYLVALSISRSGTKAVPFLKDAAEEVFHRLSPGLEAFSAAVEKRFAR
jgi:hypothetical protein